MSEKNDTEARSQALLSCRRILKALADNFYPARKNPVIGRDGKERILSDDKYINRLWQFVFESQKKNSSNDLLQSQIKSLGLRIDSLYNLSSKGVHAEVEEYEVNQCVIQTYLLIGDIFRLSERNTKKLNQG